MDNMTTAWHQTESPLRRTAYQLYHMALCAVGDAALAEQTAAGAFCDALNQIRDASDAGMLRMRCFSLLYRYCKKTRGLYGSTDGYTDAASAEYIKYAGGHRRLPEMLACLSFDERFIILLFCLQKYSVRQIATITRLPGFIVERRLNAAVGKAMR